MRKFVSILALIAMVLGMAAFQCSSTELTSARLYIQQKNYDKAIEVLEQEVAKNPNSSEGLYLLGYVHGENRNIEKMIENFDKSLKVDDFFESNITDSKNFHQSPKVFRIIELIPYTEVAWKSEKDSSE